MDILKEIDVLWRNVAKVQQRVPQHGVLHASDSGKPIRRLVMAFFRDRWPIPPLSSRAQRTFDRGHEVHDRIRGEIRRAIIGNAPTPEAEDVARALVARIPETQADEEVWDIPLIEGWVLRGHPDGVLPTGIENRGTTYNSESLLEIKSVNSFGWDDVVGGLIDAEYIVQAQMNMKGLDLHQTLFIFEKKDTQHLHQEIVTRAESTIEATIEKLKLAATIVEEITRGEGDPIMSTAPCEIEGRYGKKQDRKGWTLEWGCGYCPFATVCHPKMVQVFEAGKLRWMPDITVPSSAWVAKWGNDVLPKPTWQVLGDV